MTTTTSVWIEPSNPRHGLTLDEAAALIQEAMRADIPGDTPVLVRTGWHQQIQRASIGSRP